MPTRAGRRATAGVPGRGARFIGAAGALALAVVLAATACVPTSPSPQVRAQPEGRGKVPGVEVAPSSGCALPEPGWPAGASVVTLSTRGTTRRAELRVPEGPGPFPLLFSLHPFTQGPGPWEAYSGLADAAVARGYVVASPTGSNPGPRWAVPGGLETGADDIGFLADLADHLEDTLCVDRNAEFAAGYSAGAAMAQALSCTMPWRFAAVAGSGGMNLTETCPDSPPTDVLTLHGTADPIAPPTGSKVVFAPPLDLPIATVVATNAQRAGCDPVPVASTPAASVEALVHTGCDGGHRVAHWRMLGAGHTWAGSQPYPGNLVVGPTLSSFSATSAVLDFFDA
jgi:polyhydroxybutyrate depolymerase